MCLSCGCGEPHHHGEPDNITYEDLQRGAVAAGGLSVEQAASNIMAGLADA